MKKIPPAVLDMFKEWGAKGGKVKSEAKKRSGKINAAKALAARLAKKKRLASS